MNKRPTDTLEDEHRVILKVVGTMPVLAESLEMGASVAPDVLRDIAEFMRVFADKCHHGKEEAHLFPALERKGVPNMQRLAKVPVGQTVAEQLKLDHALEAEAVTRLNKAIALAVEKGDNGSRELLEKILVSEEEHINWLEAQLTLIRQVGEQNYLAEQMRD